MAGQGIVAGFWRVLLAAAAGIAGLMCFELRLCLQCLCLGRLPA